MFLQNAERHRAAGLASGMAKPGVSQGTASYTATGFYNDGILQRQDSTTTGFYNDRILQRQCYTTLGKRIRTKRRKTAATEFYNSHNRLSLFTFQPGSLAMEASAALSALVNSPLDALRVLRISVSGLRPIQRPFQSVSRKTAYQPQSQWPETVE